MVPGGRTKVWAGAGWNSPVHDQAQRGLPAAQSKPRKRSRYPKAPDGPLHPSPTDPPRVSLLLPYLHPNGRPPLPLPRQAPQLLPARNGLDDECRGLGAGPRWHRRQLQSARAHGGAIQPIGGAAAPGGALGRREALVGRVGAALGGDGDAGRGLAPRRDGGLGLSEVEGWGQGRAETQRVRNASWLASVSRHPTHPPTRRAQDSPCCQARGQGLFSPSSTPEGQATCPGSPRTAEARVRTSTSDRGPSWGQARRTHKSRASLRQRQGQQGGAGSRRLESSRPGWPGGSCGSACGNSRAGPGRPRLGTRAPQTQTRTQPPVAGSARR